MFAIGSKDWVENEVVEVSMLRRMVVVEIDEVLDAVVRPDVADLLQQVIQHQNVLNHTSSCTCSVLTTATPTTWSAHLATTAAMGVPPSLLGSLFARVY